MAEEINTNPEMDYKAEYEKLVAENEKLRKANTNASADASKYKKELQARMSEDEKRAAEQAEKDKARDEQLASLLKEKAISEHTANFLALKFDDELAKACATALADGNTTELFGNFKKFIELHDKAITAANVLKTPTPGTSAGKHEITKEQFSKMGYAERAKLYTENHELYETLNKGD